MSCTGTVIGFFSVFSAGKSRLGLLVSPDAGQACHRTCVRVKEKRRGCNSGSGARSASTGLGLTPDNTAASNGAARLRSLAVSSAQPYAWASYTCGPLSTLVECSMSHRNFFDVGRDGQPPQCGLRTNPRPAIAPGELTRRDEFKPFRRVRAGVSSFIAVLAGKTQRQRVPGCVSVSVVWGY